MEAQIKIESMNRFRASSCISRRTVKECEDSGGCGLE